MIQRSVSEFLVAIRKLTFEVIEKSAASSRQATPESA